MQQTIIQYIDQCLAFIQENREYLMHVPFYEDAIQPEEDNPQITISEDDLCNSIGLCEVVFCIGDINDEPLINIY